MYDIHPFKHPFTGELWKEPKIHNSHTETIADCHKRVQNLINAMIWSSLSIRDIEELQVANTSFWVSYDKLIKIGS